MRGRRRGQLGSSRSTFFRAQPLRLGAGPDAIVQRLECRPPVASWRFQVLVAVYVQLGDEMNESEHLIGPHLHDARIRREYAQHHQVLIQGLLLNRLKRPTAAVHQQRLEPVHFRPV